MQSAISLRSQRKNFFGSPTNTCKATAPLSPNRRTLLYAMRPADAYRLINCADADIESLLDSASALRDEFKGTDIT